MSRKFGIKHLFLIIGIIAAVAVVSFFIVREINRHQYLITSATENHVAKQYSRALSFVDVALWDNPHDAQALKLKQLIEQDSLVHVPDEKDLQIQALQKEILSLKLLLAQKTARLSAALANRPPDLSGSLAAALSLENDLQKNNADLQRQLDDLQAQLAALLKSAQDDQQAKLALAKALSDSNTDSADLKDKLAVALKRIKELSDMIDALNAGNQLSQESRYQVSYLVESAEDRIAKADNQGAKRLLDEALQSEPMNTRANMVLASLLLKENAFTKDSLSRIEFLLKRVAITAGDTTEVALMRGNLAVAEGKLDEAASGFTTILNTSGYNEKALTSLLAVLEKEQRWDDILSITAAYREERGDRVYIYRSRATAFSHLNHINDSINELLIARELTPSNVSIAKQLAQSYIALPNYDNAVSLLIELSKKETDFHTWQQLAFCYEQLNQPNNTFKALEHAINANPVSVKDELNEQLAMCIAASRNRLDANDTNGVVFYYKKAVSYGVETEDLKTWGNYLAEHNIK